MSESFESWTSYQYSYDNPVNFNDPMGDNPPGGGYLTAPEWYGPRMRDILDSYSDDPFSSGRNYGGNHMWGIGYGNNYSVSRSGYAFGNFLDYIRENGIFNLGNRHVTYDGDGGLASHEFGDRVIGIWGEDGKLDRLRIQYFFSVENGYDNPNAGLYKRTLDEVGGGVRTISIGTAMAEYYGQEEGQFRLEWPSITANLTAAAGGAAEYNGVGLSAGKGITAFGLKDNEFFFIGHKVQRGGLGPEIQRTWGSGDAFAGGVGFENVSINGKNISKEISIRTSPFILFEQKTDSITGRITKRLSFDAGTSSGIGLISEFGFKWTFWGN